jgi:hypothetical protein
MKPTHLAICANLVILATSCCQEAQALPPPPPGLPSPDSAPEIVNIEVLSVNKTLQLFASDLKVRRYKVEVVGKVITVQKSESGLKPGSRITIRYNGYIYNSMPVPGPGPGAYQILEKAHPYVAWLTADPNTKQVFAPFGNAPDYLQGFAQIK